MIDDLLLILSDYLESMEQGEWGRADALRAEMRLFVPRVNGNGSSNRCGAKNAIAKSDADTSCPDSSETISFNFAND
jgi:hypothetical protein